MSDFHTQSIINIYKELKTSSRGLDSKEVQARQRKFGLNKIEQEKSLGSFSIFIAQFKSPLIYTLLIAGLISVYFKEYVDAYVIFGAVLINTIIGFFQENKANNALAKLKQMVEHKAYVLRDGHEVEIISDQVTVGDILILNTGNRIPSDARVIEEKDLQINESSLTGESVPSSKSNAVIKTGASLADRENMVYAGTVNVRGFGKAVATAIGNQTEIGKIAALVKGTIEEKTPLQIKLDKLSKFFGILVGVVSVVMVMIGLLQGRDFLEMFITAVAVAVASIPEGLVVAVTVILVLGMQEILKEKALTRKLIAAETLGSISVICTDKTGTLTEGKMSVSNIIIGEKEFEVSTLGSRQDGGEAQIVSLALQVGMMCNDAFVENPKDQLEKLKIVGSPTETALLLAAIESGLNREKLLKIEPRVDELSFTSENKFMLTLHKKKGGGYTIYEKGAPERLLEKSSKFYHHGKIHDLTTFERKILDKTYEKLTGQGLRVVGVAYKSILEKEGAIKIEDYSDWKKYDKDLIFVGFIALKDPLRPEAKETIRICKEAGIRPILITGDHRLTAKAIAKEIGLKTGSQNIVIGEKLDLISDAELSRLVKEVDIFARVSPHHKLRIIQAFQTNGEVVAMTGDGVNDSPALKAADIGISLGTGTDIAKETSDLVLLDNNFKTIVSAVRQGRVIFSNIRKVITYLVSDSFCEVILIVGSILLGLPLAILPIQILWINIVNDGLPNFSLAFEKGEEGIMKEKPIKKNEPIITREMKVIIFAAGFIRDIFIFGVFYYLVSKNFNIDYVRTIVFAAVGLDSLMYIFSLRSLRQPIWKINPFSNLYLIGATFVSLLLLMLAIYWLPMQNIMNTVPLGIKSWFIVLCTGFLSIALIEAIKYYFIHRKYQA